MSWIDDEDKRCLVCDSDNIEVYFDCVTLCNRYTCNHCGYDDLLWYPDEQYQRMQAEVIHYDTPRP